MSFAFDLLLFIFIIGVTYAALISEGFFRGISQTNKSCLCNARQGTDSSIAGPLSFEIIQRVLDGAAHPDFEVQVIARRGPRPANPSDDA